VSVGGASSGRTALLASLLPLGALAAVPSSVGAGSLELGTCAETSGGERLRCGALEVPEDWDRSDGRKLRLHVVVVPALEAKPGTPPFVWLAGGPGIAASDGASGYLEELSLFREQRDVVLVDQRGPGRSNPLRCPELEGLGPLDRMYPLEAVRSCRDRLQRRADLRQYTTANSVRDLEAVRQALGYASVNLVGLSYGSLLALRYLRLHPESVRAAVLLGAAPPGKKYPLHHGPTPQPRPPGPRRSRGGCPAHATS